MYDLKEELWMGDCLTLMKTIPDASIDMVLCDLPYGTTNCKWDISIPLIDLWKEYYRICKPTAAILLFAQTPFDKVLGASNISDLRYEWIWEKTQATGFLNAKKMPMKAHENILVFYRQLPTYNAQKTTGHSPINKYTKKPEVQNKTTLYGKVKKIVSGGGETDRYPRSVLKFSSDKQKNKLNGTIHPTQKPLRLCEYLIKTYTNENDIVLDNCAGSFTTAVACDNINRNWICIEKEEKYCNIGLHRINNNRKKLNKEEIKIK
jgi:site-specific DNA-methyltransferase (adenine-specific)